MKIYFWPGKYPLNWKIGQVAAHVGHWLHIPDSETSRSPIGVIKRTGWEERENAGDATFLAFANVIQIGRDSFNVRKMATILGWEQQKKSG